MEKPMWTKTLIIFIAGLIGVAIYSMFVTNWGSLGASISFLFAMVVATIVLLVTENREKNIQESSEQKSE